MQMNGQMYIFDALGLICCAAVRRQNVELLVYNNLIAVIVHVI